MTLTSANRCFHLAALGLLWPAAGCTTLLPANAPLPLAARAAEDELPERRPIRHVPAPKPAGEPEESNESDSAAGTEGAELARQLAWLKEHEPSEYEKLRADLAAIDPAIQVELIRQVAAQLEYARQRQTAPAPREEKPVVAESPARNAEPAEAKAEPAEIEPEEAASEGAEPANAEPVGTGPRESGHAEAERVESTENGAQEKASPALVEGASTAEAEGASSGVRPALLRPPSSPAEGGASHEIALTAAAVPSPSKSDWTAHLARALDDLETAGRSPSLEPARRARLQTALRLLQLLDAQLASRSPSEQQTRREQALAAIEELEPRERQYWRHQLFALSTLLSEQGAPQQGERAALALRELREAVAQLAAVGRLDVRNAAFCSRVESFGRFVEFERRPTTPDRETYQFAPEQPTLLYVEVENFSSEAGPEGFKTTLQGSYEVFDSAGRLVVRKDFPLVVDLCRNRRRDFFIRYPMTIPPGLASGDYTLVLYLEDIPARKFGQTSLEFHVRN